MQALHEALIRGRALPVHYAPGLSVRSASLPAWA
jgi:hypothetical protein